LASITYRKAVSLAVHGRLQPVGEDEHPGERRRRREKEKEIQKLAKQSIEQEKIQTTRWIVTDTISTAHPHRLDMRKLAS